MASRGSSAWRKAEWGEPCRSDIRSMAIYSGGPRFDANVLARESFTLLGGVFLRHRYIVRRAGCYNCRPITGGSSYSSHAWGISLDVNDDTNPYRRDRLVTDMSREMILDVYRIQTREGVQVFRWGGDWDGRPEVPNSNYDAMHFEIIATPDELAAGFEHDVPENVGADPLAMPVIRRGARGYVVTVLQDMLRLQRTTGDGIFGPRTEEAVKNYQRRHGLVADGIVGHATWTALLSGQPPLGIGSISPMKIK